MVHFNATGNSDATVICSINTWTWYNRIANKIYKKSYLRG